MIRPKNETAPKRAGGSHKASIRRMFGKRFRAGSYSAFAAVAVIAIAIMVNTIVGSLPTSMTQLDMTSQNLFSLSDQTKRIVKSLDKDVELYLLTTSGNEDDTIVRLLDRYADLSDHVQVSVVDPASQPTFLDGYELDGTQIYINSVLVDCDGRSRLVGYDEIYVTSYDMDYYSYNYTTTTSFSGENALTNAIHYVSSDSIPKVYALTGHGESNLSDAMEEMLVQDNLESDSLSLLSLESIPEDAGMILINAPSSDLSADEADMLIEWIGEGGCVALTTDLIDPEGMTNLLRVTETMGLTAGEGLVIEGDSNRHLSRYPHYLLPEIQSHEITDALIDGGYYIMTPMAQPIVETGESTASVTALLTTSESAYSKLEGKNATTTEREDGDGEGPFNVGAISELGDGKLIWFSTSAILDESVDMIVSGANGNLFLNAVNWMCEQEESISIRSKSLDSESLTVTSSQSSFWSIVMVGLIPLAFIATGAAVTMRRKRK